MSLTRTRYVIPSVAEESQVHSTLKANGTDPALLDKGLICPLLCFYPAQWDAFMRYLQLKR